MRKLLNNRLIRLLLLVSIGITFIMAGMYIWAPLAIIGFIFLFLAYFV